MNAAVIKNTADLANLLHRPAPVKGMHLGELLVDEKIISRQQLQNALLIQKREPGKQLGRLLTEMGLATHTQINIALARKLGIPFVKPQEFDVSPDALTHVPADVALQYNVLPLGQVDGCLIVAMENPLDREALAMVRFNTNLRVEAVIALLQDIRPALARYYSKYQEHEALEEIDFTLPSTIGDDAAAEIIEQEAMKKPIVRLVNAIIVQAVTQQASDINIRPEKDQINIYYRIDGKLLFLRSLHKTLLPALVSRIKITGRMNIAERRLPQDGHARLVRGDNIIDLRISVIPTVNGESVVIRILDKEAGFKPFEKLGLRPRDEARVRSILSKTYGMLLVTGPTGSGKSTTLYALLNEIKRHNPHIITVEDPVEYAMDGIEQIQIALAKGYTFAEALRHILRHDPDVIMVGEIRDLETAQIANQAALTGHLVMSTLHTNDAASSITRLIDMGVEPFLLSNTLQGIIAQRLVRVNCPKCMIEEPIDLAMRRGLNIPDDEIFYRGKGCPACNSTGYRGRTIVYELLPVTPDIARLITQGKPTHEIKKLAIEQGMASLTENAILLAREGKTSLEEVFSVRLD